MFPQITDTQREGATSCKNKPITVIILLSFVIISTLFFVLCFGLLSTLPPLIPPIGEVLIGNNDVVLAVTLNSDAVSKVNFNIDASGDSFNVTLYQEPCSTTSTDNFRNNSTRQLDVTNDMHSVIDQKYIIKGSTVQYTFSSFSLDSSTPCVASIPVFLDYSDFTAFLASGFIANANASYCLPPASSITFTLSAEDQNLHYFVGLKGFQSAAVNYTLINDVINYNITELTAITCTFPTPSCSISLDSQNTCILASLQRSNTFIQMNFKVERSARYLAQLISGSTALTISFILAIIGGLFCLSKVKFDKNICSSRTVIISIVLFISAFITLGVPASIGLPFILTLPSLPREVLIGNGDVVSVTTVNDYVIKTNFNSTNPLNVTIYQDTCSEISITRSNQNYTKQLNATNDVQYIIDQAYMIEGSKVQYIFSSYMLSINSCVASIPVFLTYSDFTAFLASGLIANANASYCLPPASSITFTLSAKDNLHYFVGLQSFQSSVIDYTMQGNIREYDITDIATTVCTFPSSSCSIANPPGGQDMCILASLELSDTFVTLNYTSEQSDRYRAQLAFALITPQFIFILFFIVACCLIKKYCISKKIIS